MDTASPPRAPTLRSVTRPVPLGQVAYERIRRGLMAGGELDGVDRLIEQDLAARLAMSRTPIREALHRLALMGFLEQSAGGGYIRRSFSVRDAREHYDLRILLEPAAAELAARRDPADRQAGLQRLLVEAASVDERAATRFHLAVAELSGNQVLSRVIANVTERLAGFGVPEAYPDTLPQAFSAHGQIAHLIEQGDPAAGPAMADHLEACEAALIAHLATADRSPAT
jgi:GntR family transcriptional regulator, vanillate catabolism transcriptional regulator